MEIKLFYRRMMSLMTNPTFDILQAVGDQWLRARHVCKLLDASRATLRRLVQAGELTPIPFGRRSIRYSLLEVRRFMEGRKSLRTAQIRPENFAMTEAEEDLVARVQRRQRALTLGGG